MSHEKKITLKVLARVREAVVVNRCDGETEYAQGIAAANRNMLVFIDNAIADCQQAEARTTQPAQQDAVDAEQIEAAAKELSKCMDYPWEHMPASGRSHMRETAKAVIRAAISAKKGQR